MLRKLAVLTNKADNSISIVSFESNMLLETIPFPGQPNAVAVDSSKNIALISKQAGIAIVKLENPVPLIGSVVPESANAGSSGLQLSIGGGKFIRDSKARFNLTELDTLFEDGVFCTTPRKGKIQKIGDPGGFESEFEG